MVKVTTTEDRGYWTSGGGGGGSGGYIPFEFLGQHLVVHLISLLTLDQVDWCITNGSVTSNQGYGGFAQIRFKKIVGYEGGTTGVTTGDHHLIDGSGTQDNGVNFFASGTGTTSSGGFKLPQTQTPTVEFIGGGGGSGATATVQISGGVITGFDTNKCWIWIY